jgi:methionyl-tRNA formyltransferase
MDLFLSGIRGVSAAKVAVEYRDLVGSVVLANDSGELGNHYLATLQLLKLNDIVPVNADESHLKSDSCLAVGWKRMIKSDYSSIFVIHDSLLPRYRGWNPLVTALQNGDKELGATLILADDQVDCGPIIKSHQFEVSPPVRISDALQSIGNSIEFLTRYLFENINQAAVLAVPQNHSLATISLWRDEDDYQIDWTLSAEKILLFIYSVSHPYKGACTFLDSRKIIVLDAEVVQWAVPIENPAVGKMVAVDNVGPVVICGEGFLRLKDCRLDSIDGEIVQIKRVRTRFK